MSHELYLKLEFLQISDLMGLMAATLILNKALLRDLCTMLRAAGPRRTYGLIGMDLSLYDLFSM